MAATTAVEDNDNVELAEEDAAGEWILEFDGAARGNRVCGAGVLLRRPSGIVEWKAAKRLGEVTNNVAEYTALLHGLRNISHILPVGASLLIRGDSKLVIEQVKGGWVVRASHLEPLRDEAQALVETLRTTGHSVRLEHVRREFNRDADALSNEGCDKSVSDEVTE